MVIAVNIYLRFYIEVGVNTFLLTPTPPEIPFRLQLHSLDKQVLVLVLFRSQLVNEFRISYAASCIWILTLPAHAATMK
jgi:hypothetical protein